MMPVRSRITLLFLVLVAIILGIVCASIYYFSYTARLDAIKIRLTNRAITTARLLYRNEIFDQRLVQRIDSLTTISLKNKIVQAYDYQNRKIYSYSDSPDDTLQVDNDILNDSRVNGIRFFKSGLREAVAYQHVDRDTRIVVVTAAEDVEGMKSLQVLINILLVSFLAGNVVVIVVGYFFSGKLLEPIKKIAADVDEISALNLTRRIETGKSKDEWNQLAGTLNKLLDRLQESFDLQRRFISNASHEISTPLTSILSQLEVSLQRQRDAAEYRLVMQSIYQDVRHMTKLTQTLLEFAKASGDAGGLTINLVRIDEILLRLPAAMVKLNKDYTAALEFEQLPENEEDLLVFGNEELLFTAIKNIVQNACKYSNDRKATVILSISEKEIFIEVSDKGRGIPESELKTIFQPFFRVQENVGSEGFGLGLSMADRIIKLHKGNISVTSELDRGTTFTIMLNGAKALQQYSSKK